MKLNFNLIATFLILSISLTITNLKKVDKGDYKPEQLKNLKTLNFTSKNAKTNVILNSIGQRVSVSEGTEILLEKAPFKITRCDQIVSFKAQYIPDMGEYRNREDGWFTITAHFINLFKDNNANNLIRSILSSESPILPHHLRGTGSCILVSAGPGENDITICVEDSDYQQNILEVLQAFFKCRGGQAKEDKLQTTRDLLSCAGKGGRFIDPRLLLKKLKKIKAKKERVASNADFYHPGSDDVPGIPGVGNRDVPDITLRNIKE